MSEVKVLFDGSCNEGIAFFYGFLLSGVIAGMGYWLVSSIG